MDSNTSVTRYTYLILHVSIVAAVAEDADLYKFSAPSMRVLLCVVACLAVATPDQLDEVDPHVNPLYYTNVWAVKIPGGAEVAKRVAEARGFSYMEPVSERRFFITA